MKLLSVLADLLFPPRCVVCGELLPNELTDVDADDESGDGVLCPYCRAAYEAEKSRRCGHCGNAVTSCFCQSKLLEKAGFLGLVKTAGYFPGDSGAVGKMIYRIKHFRDKRLAAFMGAQLARCVLLFLREHRINAGETVITYVPRSGKALIEYGFDQAKLLAEYTSRSSGIAVETLIKRRSGSGREQKLLNYSERVENSGKAFAPAKGADLKAAGRFVIIVDDISTSGASMESCGDCLDTAAGLIGAAFAGTIDKRRG